MGPTTANRSPHFFVSYVHDSGEDDANVHRLYGDLCHDVRLYAGLPRDADVGFCDVSLRAGDRWSPALVEALCTCQVFLALCSPRYFASAACGKEWTIFAGRLPGGPGHGTSSLIPLFWVPMQMPDVVQPYQYRDTGFGATYHESGLRDLTRMGAHKDRYLEFVTVLARRIVDLSRRLYVEPYRERPPFDDVDPAFGGAAGSGGWHPPRQQLAAPAEGRAAAHRPDPPANGMPKLNPADPLRPPGPHGDGERSGRSDAA